MPAYLIVLLALALSLIATGVVLNYARRHLLDQINERSSHSIPTPRGGGLGLSIGLLIAWLVGAWAGGDGTLLATATCLAALAALGWWDDHADLPARWRLLGQFSIASTAVAMVGVPAAGSFGPWQLDLSPWIVWPIAVIGTVWLINLTNFMDGIDGIAGGQGLVAGAAAGVLLAGTSADPRWAALGWAMAGACAGFLWWNRPPARIFMGDVGSTTLGLVFAILVLAQLRAGIALDLALLPLLPFVADATATLIRRAWRRERLSQAHRSHLYQRLARHWEAHLPATLAWSGLAVLASCGAWTTMHGFVPPLTALGTCLALFIALAWYGNRKAPS